MTIKMYREMKQTFQNEFVTQEDKQKVINNAKLFLNDLKKLDKFAGEDKTEEMNKKVYELAVATITSTKSIADMNIAYYLYNNSKQVLEELNNALGDAIRDFENVIQAMEFKLKSFAPQKS